MDEDREQDAPAEIPVLHEIVEIRTGPDGQRTTVPLDLDQLAERITAALLPQLRRNLDERLQACLDQALDESLDKIRQQVQRVLLEQLGNPDS
ncbi:MAG: hypothetical protein LPJ94_04675 [Thauera sp.]|nr:hypothetical protein [Thauera sp.]